VNLVVLFCIEVIQILDEDFCDYISDKWNINDLSMQFLFWFYCFLRLFSTDYGGNFLLVKEVEFEDSHKETEYILKMLQNFNDTQYMSEYAGVTDEYCLKNHYN